MPPAIDITGVRYGRLVAVGRAEPRGPRTLWRCRCDCGSETLSEISNLRGGRSTSCGCQRTETMRSMLTEHGLHKHPLHNLWCGIFTRCYNAKSPPFRYYGARGIAVCERWRDFANFLADMGERPSPKHSLDRINNDGNYEPSNCRWATAIEQANNKRPRGTA